MSNGSDMEERILSGMATKCNQELDPRKRSGLIAGEESACIGKTYRAIYKTFESYDHFEVISFHYCAQPCGDARLQ